MSEMIDDKSDHCISFIVDCLQSIKAEDDQHSPLFLGMNGAQGSGKSTLVSTLAEKLRQPPFSLPTIVFSIDDLYLTHEVQCALAAAHSSNPLVQHRGQPSTHDLPLAISVFSDLRAGKETRIPSYDKSAYNGQGDRASCENWVIVNQADQPRTEIVIFEGWCVGYRSLTKATLSEKWKHAVEQRKEKGYQGRLGWNKLEDVEFVNECLKEYDVLTDQLDALIHLDAADPLFVYGWRLEQETKLRVAKGAAMTDEQVKQFVDGYYPAYELFVYCLRAGAMRREGRQLKLLLGKDRKVQEIIRI